MENEMFSFTLYDGGIADSSEIATAKNDATGKISFGQVKVYNPDDGLDVIATMTEPDDESITCETEYLEKGISLELNEDGSLGIKEEP